MVAFLSDMDFQKNKFSLLKESLGRAFNIASHIGLLSYIGSSFSKGNFETGVSSAFIATGVLILSNQEQKPIGLAAVFLGGAGLILANSIFGELGLSQIDMVASFIKKQQSILAYSFPVLCAGLAAVTPKFYHHKNKYLLMGFVLALSMNLSKDTPTNSPPASLINVGNAQPLQKTEIPTPH